mgnify:CR=1 FL=1
MKIIHILGMLLIALAVKAASPIEGCWNASIKVRRVNL